MSKINKKLKAKIVEVYGTQADFAQVAGMDESLVSRILRGRRPLDAEGQKKWAKLLKANVGDLLA
jgi:transcriptional regulator with XRE-family HTH domain